jgi:DNA-binding NarL/FixJ family response regulator
VEDKEIPLDDIVTLIETMDELELKRRRIKEKVVPATAMWFSQAKALLREAADAGDPFDIVIMDLYLPVERPHPDEPTVVDKQAGLKLIEYATEKGAARQIIVYTAHAEYEYVRSAFLNGAVDIVSKGEKDSESLLVKSILAAWDRLIADESAHVLAERFKALVPYAQKGLAHWFSGSFSRLIQSVSQELDGLRANVGERLGLDVERDRHDPFVWRLVSIQKSLKEATEEWSALHATIADDAEGPNEVVVEEKLRDIVHEVLPCLTLKRTEAQTPLGGRTRVLSFSDDVGAILREIIVGGVSEVRDRGRRSEDSYLAHTITVTVSERAEKAEVRFEDNLPPVSPEDAEKINKGYAVALDKNFGRAWGLSVAQHAALRGGGRLKVGASNGGNVISYFIPIAN